MKKIIAITLFVVCLFSCVGCSGNEISTDTDVNTQVESPTDVVENNDTVEQDIVDNNVTVEQDTPLTEDEVSKTPTEEVAVLEVKNANDICGYMNYLFENVEFKVQHQMTDYFDEYFNMNIQEYSYITGINDDGFEVFGITTAFVDNRLADFSMTVNTKDDFDIYDYQDTVNTVSSLVGYNYGMTKAEVAEIMDKFYDFDAYSDNEYGNQQTSFAVSEIACVSVIFEGGKDFEYDGTTYYYILSAIG